jgi:ATP-binding cassette subfamily F protein uup
VIAPEGDGRWLEYAGGYADMMAQRKEQALERRNVKTANARAGDKGGDSSEEASQPKREEKRKLSFKQKFALETLPGKMDALGKEITVLEGKLADPQLYAKDPTLFAKTADLLEKKRSENAAMEEEWLELEMLREEIEG